MYEHGPVDTGATLMRFKTWPVAALGLGSLLLLIVVSMLASSRKAQEIYTQLDQLNTHHHEVDTKLRRLRSDVNLSGIFVRDYLLDVARERAPNTASSLAEFRETNMATVAELRAARRAATERIASLQAQAGRTTGRPSIRCSTGRRPRRSSAARGFLRREVVPRREAVLAIAQEIEELNNANLAAQRAEVARRHAAFRADLHRLLWQTRAARPGGRADRRVPAARARAAIGRAAERSPKTRSARCASSRSGWSRRRRKSGRTCRANCTTTSHRC